MRSAPNNHPRRTTLWLLPTALAVGLPCWIAGCKSPAPPPEANRGPAFSYYRDDQVSTPAVRRVVVLPLENKTDYPQAAALFRDSLVEQLRSAGLFEVVAIPPDRGETWRDAVHQRGRFPEQLLVDMARNHNADAVLFGCVSDYQPYWPPRVGVTLHLVSTHEAITLASVDGLWDTRAKAVAYQAERFYTELTPQHTLPHSELVLHAPRYFNTFVARQIAGSLAAQWQP